MLRFLHHDWDVGLAKLLERTVFAAGLGVPLLWAVLRSPSRLRRAVWAYAILLALLFTASVGVDVLTQHSGWADVDELLEEPLLSATLALSIGLAFESWRPTPRLEQPSEGPEEGNQDQDSRDREQGERRPQP